MSVVSECHLRSGVDACMVVSLFVVRFSLQKAWYDSDDGDENDKFSF